MSLSTSVSRKSRPENRYVGARGRSQAGGGSSTRTSALTPSASSRPWWFSEARTLASRWNRDSRSGSVANASGRILRATWRLSAVSRLIDLSHAALADEGGHVVMAEAGADVEGHELLGLRLRSFYAQAVSRYSVYTELRCPRNLRCGFEKWPIMGDHGCIRGDHGCIRSPADVR